MPCARKYPPDTDTVRWKMLQTSFQLSIGRDHLAQPKCDFSPKRVSVLRPGLNLCSFRRGGWEWAWGKSRSSVRNVGLLGRTKGGGGEFKIMLWISYKLGVSIKRPKSFTLKVHWKFWTKIFIKTKRRRQVKRGGCISASSDSFFWKFHPESLLEILNRKFHWDKEAS